ncbi:hypothetical protein MHYP_G00183190 [Metynnis hypsauchen]
MFFRACRCRSRRCTLSRTELRGRCCGVLADECWHSCGERVRPAWESLSPCKTPLMTFMAKAVCARVAIATCLLSRCGTVCACRLVSCVVQLITAAGARGVQICDLRTIRVLVQSMKKPDFSTTTSDGTKQGIDSMRGGVCVTRGMKVVLKVGQTAYGLPPKPKPDPARTNTRTPGQNDEGSSSKDEAGGQSDEGTVPASNIALIAGGAGGAAFLLLVAAVIGVVCYRRRKAKHSETHHPALSLSSLTPKRGSGTGVMAGGPSMGVNTGGSEPSDIIIPLRTSDSAYCPHYEKVSGDYGHPVYIVQEMPPQSPANIYYKV